MKVYGETIFDICYLSIAVLVGLSILANGKSRLIKLMGTSTLVLGCGDAFHLIPRVLDYFLDYDFTAYLGIGKLVTSITMTIFYIFMFYIYKNNYRVENNKSVEYSIWFLAIIRIILCLLPQNRWLTNDGDLAFGIIRNAPFVILGGLIIILFYKVRKEDRTFNNMWIYILLSFLFYIPVVVGASFVPALGMFMLPKTICYILIVLSFKRKSKESC